MSDNKKITFTFIKDDTFNGIGGFLQGSMTEQNPQIIFNLEAIFHAFKNEPNPQLAEGIREAMCEVLTHEFAHAIQEYLRLEMSEAMVDRILAAYNKNWATREEQPEEDTPMVDANSVIRFLEALQKETDIESVNAKINNIMPSLKSWGYTGAAG